MMGSSWKDHWLLKIYPPFLSRLFAKASRGATVVSSSEGTYLIFLISLISLHFYYMQAMQQPFFLLLLLQASIRWTHSRPNGQHEGKTCREAFPPCTITSQPAGVTDDPQCKYSIFRTLCVCTWGVRWEGCTLWIWDTLLLKPPSSWWEGEMKAWLDHSALATSDAAAAAGRAKRQRKIPTAASEAAPAAVNGTWCCDWGK